MSRDRTGGAKRIPLPPIGSYVLATKWRDGDSKDHWAVGFIVGMYRDRYDVADAVTGGRLFRGNGFRRVEEISAKRGAWLLKNKTLIESSDRSVWWWKRQSMRTEP